MESTKKVVDKRKYICYISSRTTKVVQRNSLKDFEKIKKVVDKQS
jgi:hypothetical protein